MATEIHPDTRQAAPRLHAGVWTTIRANETETILWRVEVNYATAGARALMAHHADTIELPASVTRERAAIIAAALLDVPVGRLGLTAL